MYGLYKYILSENLMIYVDNNVLELVYGLGLRLDYLCDTLALQSEYQQLSCFIHNECIVSVQSKSNTNQGLRGDAGSDTIVVFLLRKV